MRYARRKRSFRRSRRFRRGRKTRMAFAKGTVRTSRSFRRFGRQLNAHAEKKIVTFIGALAGYSVQNTGYIVVAPTIVRGTDGNQRIGNKVFIRYLVFKFILDTNNTGTNEIRISFVWPRDKTYASLANCPTSNLLAEWDTEKFIILYDKILVMGQPLNPTVNAYQYQNARPTTKYIYRSHKIMKSFEFDNTTNSPIESFPFMFLWSVDALLPSPIVFYNTKITFTDV